MATIEDFPYEKLSEGVHLPQQGPALTMLLDAIDKELTSMINHMNLVQDNVYADTAWGESLDDVGVLLDYPRKANQTDVDYRAALINRTATIEQSTIAAVEDAIEDLMGYKPDVEEYPEVNFMEMYGAEKNVGIFRVLIPGNKEDYFTDAEILVNMVKAAGVRAIVELGNIFYESFEEIITLSDVLFFGGVEYLTEDLPRMGAIIGEATIGVSVIGETYDWNDGTKTMSIQETF